MRLRVRSSHLLLALLTVAVGALAPAGSEADTWRLVNEPGFDNLANKSVSAMAIFDGHLYVATDNDETGSEIWKSRLGSWRWRPITPPWSAGTTRARAMAVFDGRLYVGTDQGEVWRTAGEITLSPCQRSPFQPGGCLKFLDAPLVLELWSEATPTGGWRGSEISSLAGFGGRLFLTANAPLEIWRSSDGLTWSPVEKDIGLLDRENNHSGQLRVFRTHLYVATSREVPGGSGPGDGLEIWRSADGVDWSAVVATDEPGALLPNGFGLPGNTEAAALAVFRDRLYVSTVNHAGDGAQIWRFDGSEWENVTPADTVGAVRIQSLAVFGRRIFAGQGFAVSTPAVWSSLTGDVWGLDSRDGLLESGARAVEAMIASQTHLYLGTRGNVESGGLLIWEKQRSLADQGLRAPTPCLVPQLCGPPFPPVLTPGD